METGFLKADSNNLPKVNSAMVAGFFANNPDFFGPELKNIKASRATREEYGDNAIGYVQIKKQGNEKYVIKGKITPEHRIRSTPYSVQATVNVRMERVLEVRCDDCAASEGGCKHAVAFLMWLHRRSEEPSVTAVTCYWKKSALSQIGNCKMDMRTAFKQTVPPLGPSLSNHVSELVEKVPEATGGVFSIARCPTSIQLSVWQLAIDYTRQDMQPTDDKFIDYMSSRMSADLCRKAEQNTRNQSNESIWFELRFGRITASKLCEASQSHTLDGSLVEAIMGASTVPETPAILRGRNLEKMVIAEVERLRNITIEPSGLLLTNEYPTFGASPDGISTEFCIEVKCPASVKTHGNSIKGQRVLKKYECQLQLQMLFAGKSKGLFCVAAHDFEQSKKVDIVEIALDLRRILKVVKRAQSFWKKSNFSTTTETQ